jgi:hypothetical protein
MSFSRPIQWYHSYTDPIWPDSTFKSTRGKTRRDESYIICCPIFSDVKEKGPQEAKEKKKEQGKGEERKEKEGEKTTEKPKSTGASSYSYKV